MAMAIKNKNGLTEYQQRFVDEYMVDLNQGQAIIRAGFKGQAASANTASCRMMQNVNVKAEVQRRIAERSERTQITADRVLRELALIGFYDIREIFDNQNNLKGIRELTGDSSRAIASIEIEVDKIGTREISTTKKIKMHDKIRALQLIGSHIGMFKESTSSAEDIAKALKELSQNLPG